MNARIARRKALALLAAAPLAVATLPATLEAAPLAPVAPSRDDLYAAALGYVHAELAAVDRMVREDPRLTDDGAWMGLWAVFFGSVARAKADAIAVHGDAARAAWDDAGGLLYRGLRFALDRVGVDPAAMPA